ncbi:MBL fold metallo-hydrolase [Aureimonas sp. SK2]|uniref:MBL fold metallo-hydrolase n=1 Tax=Aureimonas sp. SK2 TaxID=3015992 RepID=UPI002443DDCB|nr:MBL fold metallo-hydrolase [Aureimonas sp. SK2]
MFTFVVRPKIEREVAPMPDAFEVNRRNALLLAAGGVAGTMAPRAAAAQGSTMEATSDTHPLAPGWRRFMIGDAEVTVILDGIRPGEGPFPTFGEDQSQETVGALMEENFLPAQRFANFFQPVVIRLGEELILVDTGMGANGRANGMGLLTQRMGAAGLKPGDVTLVVLTHLHGDHIGGLMEGGVPVFSNARYAVGRTEMEFWTSDDAKNGPRAENAKAVEATVVPLQDKTTLLGDGDEVVPGMTARAAFGHTPGMMAFEVSSAGERLFLMADTFSHFIVSFQRPDWQVRFDQDKTAAAETRRRFAGMLADAKVPLLGYHLPFPGLGYVERDGDAFRFVPETYQLLADG